MLNNFSAAGEFGRLLVDFGSEDIFLAGGETVVDDRYLLGGLSPRDSGEKRVLVAGGALSWHAAVGEIPVASNNDSRLADEVRVVIDLAVQPDGY
jgi:hypothetical protein